MYYVCIFLILLSMNMNMLMRAEIKHGREHYKITTCVQHHLLNTKRNNYFWKVFNGKMHDSNLQPKCIIWATDVLMTIYGYAFLI